MRPSNNQSKVHPQTHHTTNHTPRPVEPARPAPNGSPYANRKPKEPAIKRIAAAIHTVFSHKGSFVIGVVVAAVSICANVWFYRSLLTAGGLAPLTAIGGALLISFSTTIFELIPSVQKSSPLMAYYEAHRTASRPNRVPTRAAQYAVDNYVNVDRKNEEFFKAMRIFAYAIEGFIAVIFLGNIGTGFRAMLRLLLFVASLLGCEWGVKLALRSAERELPAEAKEAADAEWRNSAQNPQYRPID